MVLSLSTLLRLALLLPLAGATAASALEAMPDVPMALLAPGGPPKGGTYRAGLALDLPEGWHTYWISPGDAGIPPVIEAAGSDNLADLAVAYPLPKRHDDGVSISLVYEGRLVLPLRVRAADAGKPVHLHLSVAIGLCRDVCLPVNAELDAVLDPAAPPDAAAVADIAAFEARVPTPVPDDGARLALVSAGGDAKRGEMVVTVAVADGDDLVDLFAYARPPWSALPPEPAGREGDRALYKVTLYGPRESAGLDDLALTYVMVGKSGATMIDSHVSRLVRHLN